MSIPGSGSPLLLATTAAAAADAAYVIPKSLRFNSGDSAYLNRTPSSAGNRKTWTWSAWVKKADTGVERVLFNAHNSSDSYTRIRYVNTNQFQVYMRIGSGTNYYIRTAGQHRDHSAWYHLVVAVDTTQATAANRVKLYVNGVEATLDQTIYPPQNGETAINSTLQHSIGSDYGSNNFDGQMADIQLVDGQALAPTDFGETRSSDGVWVPKEYTGSYGPAVDQTQTWSSALTDSTGFASGYGATKAFDGITTADNTARASAQNTTTTFQPATDIAYTSKVEVWTYFSGSVSLNGGSAVTVSNDQDWRTIATGSGTLDTLTFTGSSSFVYLGGIRIDGVLLVDPGVTVPHNGFHLNFSDSSTNEALGFDSAPTTPDPDPKKGMDVITWTGNGSTQNIGGLNFEPGLIWIKERGGTKDHNLYDSIRGATKELFPNGTGVENTLTNGLTSFNPDGFTLGSADRANGNTQTYVAWTWRAGGPAVANSDGAVNSQVSVNTDYGFSIVTVTPTATGQTVGHGLNTTPSWIIYKNRDTAGNWRVHHTTLGTSKTLFLNTNASQSTSSDRVTAVTSSTFTLGDIVANDDHVAYCWSEVAGFSKFGSYAGSGASGKQVTGLGFKPRYLIVKAYDASASWVIVDSERGGDKLLFAEASNGDSSGDTILFLDDGFQIQGGGGDQNYSGRNYIYAAFADRPGNNWDVNNIVTNEGLTTSKTQFDVVTYTGNGGTQSIDSLAFQPDFVWIKMRSAAAGHRLYDSVRGATKYLVSQGTDSEGTQSAGLTSFNSDGFTVGSNFDHNNNNSTFVAWCWKAGGTAVSNTNGSITSSVSANAAYGFSIVSWTGDGSSSATVGHSLGVAPKMVIIKGRETTNGWSVYHKSLTSNYVVNLQTTSAQFANSASVGGGTGTPTNSVLTFDSGSSNVNNVNKSGNQFIAYCFADVPGYQRVGQYTGNGSSTGPVVVTGFKPRFLLIKRTDAVANWYLLDTERDSSNPVNALLRPNIADAEISAVPVDILQNGFQPKDTDFGSNASGGTYIYLAIGDDEIGSDEDCLVDVPNAVTADADATDTTGGYQRGNYCTWNPLAVQPSGHGGFRDGNLEIIADTAGSHKATLATFALPSTGKWYWEVKAYRTGAINNGGGAVGVAEASAIVPTAASGNRLGEASSSSWTLGLNDFHARHANTVDYSGYLNGGSAEVDTGIIGIAVDMDNDKMWMHYNGVYGNAGGTGDPVGGANPMFSGEFAGKTLFPAAGITVDSGSGFLRANFGQMRFKYPMPSGYAALNTTALPAATIADGSAHFDTVLYTGTGAAKTISGLNLSPDMAWIKERNDTNWHRIIDAVRGQKEVFPNATNTESSFSQGLNSFNSDGFTLGTGSDSNVNTNNNTYVGWLWDAGSSTVSNTDGSITSSVRANASAGFSILTFTNTTSNSTVGHGLNAKPDLIIWKKRSGTSHWGVYHSSLGATKYLYLNLTNAASTGSEFWNNTEPTSSVITTRAEPHSFGSAGDTVMYVFTAVAGYSAFGSYTGNGSSDGPFIYTGFKPRWVMYKRTDSTADWEIKDSARDTYNPTDETLIPNTAGAAYTGYAIDILSNGFKPRTSGNAINNSGGTYIYAAFAENPFQANGGLAR